MKEKQEHMKNEKEKKMVAKETRVCFNACYIYIVPL